jgi:hypothetical protein
MCWGKIPVLLRWIKQEPPTLRQWIAVAALAAVIFCWGRISSRGSAEQKLLQSQREREEQEKQLVQNREEQEMRLQLEREEGIQKFLAPIPPQSPEKLKKETEAGNEVKRRYWAEREGQRFANPGGDAQDQEDRQFTDLHGVIRDPP